MYDKWLIVIDCAYCRLKYCTGNGQVSPHDFGITLPIFAAPWLHINSSAIRGAGHCFDKGLSSTDTVPQHSEIINLIKSTGHVMYHQFNIQQLYALPTLYLCVLYLSENKQRLVPLTALVFITEMKSVYSAVRTGSLNRAVCASSFKG